MILTSVFIFLVLQIFVSCDEYLVPQNINVDDIIKSDRLMRNYLDCVLEKGKCTPEGEELKSKLFLTLTYIFKQVTVAPIS
jgi:hypothetical protein